MSSRPKLIHCSGHDPVSAHRSYEVPWCDVWIRWAGRGREVVRLGPTFIGLADLKSDLFILRECQKENPDLDFKDAIANAERMLTLVKANGWTHDHPHPHRTPSIYTRADYFDRGEVERLLRLFMAECYGFDNIRFKWHRKNGSFAMPVTINVPDTEDKNDDAE